MIEPEDEKGSDGKNSQRIGGANFLYKKARKHFLRPYPHIKTVVFGFASFASPELFPFLCLIIHLNT